MISRRNFSIGLVATPLIARAAATFSVEDIVSKLETSKLIYLTPIKSNGDESKCKAEIWFLYHQSKIYLVTPKDAWRTEAIGKGLNKARIWVGEFGNWRRANETFRSAPELMATADIVADADIHTEVLRAMGAKYTSEWSTWGPRFKSALEDGSRVMLRYSPDGVLQDA